MPQFFAPVAGVLLADRPQQLRDETVDVTFDLEQPLGLAATVAAERFANQRQADPLVALLSAHRALGEENQVTSLARLVVQQLHQLDAAAGDPVA